MNVKKGCIFCLAAFLGIGIVLVICLHAYTAGVNEKQNNTFIADSQVLHLPQDVRGLKTGELYAKKRAQEWRKNVLLMNVSAKFKSVEDLKNSNGELFYLYGVKSNDVVGYSTIYCGITVDTTMQAITKFNSFGDKREAGLNGFDIAGWNLDIDDLHDFLKNNVPNYFQHKANDTYIMVMCYKDSWEISDVPNEGSGKYSTKTILKISTSDRRVIEKNDIR